MSTTTYHVGNAGYIRKLINNTTPWSDVSFSFLSGSTPPVYHDVMTDPNDGDKVFVVGQALLGNSPSFYGVLVSSNGGLSWSIPTGTYQATANQFNFRLYEVWVVDSSNSYACGEYGTVIKSTNGGSTYNTCTQLPAGIIVPGGQPIVPTAYSLHFISATTGVVGCRNLVYKTTDGGTTWTSLTIIPYVASNLPQNIVGIHMSADEQTIVACGTQYIIRSTDGGATWSVVYSWSSVQEFAGKHLTWIDDNNLWATGARNVVVQSTDAGASWTQIQATTAFGDNRLAGHFYNINDGYLGVNTTEQVTSNSGNTVATSEVVPGAKTLEAVWTYYEAPPCYLLTNCCDIECTFVVSNDLAAYVGQTINLPVLPDVTCINNIVGYKNCFTVELSQDCTQVIQIDTTGLTSFQDCDECLPTYYTLTNCADDTDIINTSTDFSQYVGQVVNLSNCGDRCYTVTSNTSCILYYPTDNTVTNSFATCQLCSYVPPVPRELKKRSVKPGYDTPTCSPEYYFRISCGYSTAVYDEMVKERYGITICCDRDINYWDVKKELLDFQAILDPDPLLVDIPCTCWTITQTVGSGTYSYVSCAGIGSLVTVLAGESITVCSKYIPCMSTCIQGSAYSISGLGTECTDNQSCIPEPAPICYCYTVSNITRDPVTVNYVSCETGLPSQYQLDAGGTFYVCAQEGTVTGGTVSTTSVLCTTTESCQPAIPCNEYSIQNATQQPFIFNYTNCNGLADSVTINPGDTLNFCGSDAPALIPIGPCIQ